MSRPPLNVGQWIGLTIDGVAHPVHVELSSEAVWIVTIYRENAYKAMGGHGLFWRADSNISLQSALDAAVWLVRNETPLAAPENKDPVSTPPFVPRVEAYRWCCFDDCDCVQWRIDRVTLRTGVRESLWSGEFRSDSGFQPRAEQAEDLRAFRSAARRLGVRLHHDGLSWVGETPLAQSERT